MRLRHIEVFNAIMQVGTISGAAQVLHISQPAVTKILQQCEQQLGIGLFERVRGKLYPKPEAHRLFAETEKLSRDLLGIRRLAASLKSRAVETVRLVSTPTVAISVLPQAMENRPGAGRRQYRHHQAQQPDAADHAPLHAIDRGTGFAARRLQPGDRRRRSGRGTGGKP